MVTRKRNLGVCDLYVFIVKKLWNFSVCVHHHRVQRESTAVGVVRQTFGPRTRSTEMSFNCARLLLLRTTDYETSRTNHVRKLCYPHCARLVVGIDRFFFPSDLPRKDRWGKKKNNFYAHVVRRRVMYTRTKSTIILWSEDKLFLYRNNLFRSGNNMNLGFRSGVAWCRSYSTRKRDLGALFVRFYWNEIVQFHRIHNRQTREIMLNDDYVIVLQYTMCRVHYLINIILWKARVVEYDLCVCLVIIAFECPIIELITRN